MFARLDTLVLSVKRIYVRTSNVLTTKSVLWTPLSPQDVDVLQATLANFVRTNVPTIVIMEAAVQSVTAGRLCADAL